MERSNEKVIDQIELADEDLEQAAGGWRITRWFYKSGSGTEDGGGTGTNSTWFVTTVT